ncbi:MAG: chalcone isomerase family protein [Planctomycetales bacterium]|nr:chalcone isomerase family protein [Planctomycetales bacterium]
MPRPCISTAFALAILFSPAAARAAKLPATIKVAKQELTLNGEGVREKYLLDLYVAGLYLPTPSRDAKSIIAADQLMAIRIAVVSKLVSQEKLVQSLDEGFEKSTGGKLKPLQAQLQQFRRCFAGEIARGDLFDLIYVPKQGVFVFKNGKRIGVVAGLPFKQALFGIWLGASPVDPTLRTALLGTAETSRQ